MSKRKLALKLPLAFLFCTLAVLVAFRSVARASPGTIFSDGFESGDFGAWSGTNAPVSSTVEVVSSPVHSGSYSAHLSNGGADTTPFLWKDFTSLNTAYARVYARFADLSFLNGKRAIFFTLGMAAYPAYTSRVSVYNNNGNYVWRLDMQDDDANAFNNISSQAVALNTWYSVEVKKVADASVGECRLYVDGAEVLSITGKNTAITGKCDRFLLDGETFGQVSLTNNYFDDAVVDSSYIGPAATQVTFDQTGLSSNVTGAVVNVDGFNYTFTQLPLSFWWNAGSSHTFVYQSPLVASLKEKYVWTFTNGTLGETAQSGSITAESSGTVVGNYVNQYLVGGEIINTPTLFNYFIIFAIATVAVAGVALLFGRLLSSRFPKPVM